MNASCKATLLVISLMICSSIQYVVYPLELKTTSERMEQFGGGSLEEQCGSITFEDMFIYDNAIFQVLVQEDWKSAQVDARAWINWSLADDIRTDLDSYLEGYVPSGGDGWLSSDEIDAVTIIAADCLEYSLTRIGLRDGPPHRGGTGVDWKNTTWENDGMVVGHYNGVPPRHSQIRNCDSFSQEGCMEIPVSPSIERDCDTGANSSLGLDECRIELWLNATMSIEGISDPNDFTLAFNTSNMSNGRIEFTFPTIPELRLDMWEECEGRFVGPDEDNPGTGTSPIRGSCIGDGSANYELKTNEDGSLTYSLESNFSRGEWPLGEDIFADFTTSSFPLDSPPVWTESAPNDGVWIPVSGEGQTKIASWSEISTWFDDDAAVSSLEITCMSDEAGGTLLSQSIDGSIWANIQGIVEVSCMALDASGQSTTNRTFVFGVPLYVSPCDCTLEDSHPITLGPSEGWTNLTTEIGFYQGGEPRNVVTMTLLDETTVQLSSTGMVPGPVEVWIKAYSDPRYVMQAIYDLSIFKESTPPQIIFSSHTWEGSELKVSGQYSDPDGEAVSFTAEVSELDSQAFSIAPSSGNSWELLWYDPDLSQLSGDLELVVTGCDASGKCSTERYVIDADSFPSQSEVRDDNAEQKDESVPSAGVITLSASILGAMLLGRRVK